MKVVVNNPAQTSADPLSGNGLLIGTILVVGISIVFVYFGVPAIRRLTTAQISVPAPQVVVPNKIDVNITRK
jgi:hypothetical protein